MMAFLHNGCGLAFAHPQSDLPLIKASEPRRISSGPSALHLKSKSLPFLDAPGSLDGSFAGDIGFDPLGLSEIPFDFSQLVVPRQFSGRPSSATLATLYWMREAEVKHGRVAMLAVLGCVAVDLGARLPGAAFAGVRDALGAHDVMVARGPMALLLLAAGAAEVLGGAAVYEAAKGSGREPGDFQLDPFSLVKGDPVRKKDFQTKEIKNGRLAMIGISGILTQAGLEGQSVFPYLHTIPLKIIDAITDAVMDAAVVVQ
mmetsp:Transcript_17240/g.23693  ORF Transcript_17240/g.23693 Transcript_17240/m.23693 type:complete len:258 (-) Transcript_17240:154-927(-)